MTVVRCQRSVCRKTLVFISAQFAIENWKNYAIHHGCWTLRKSARAFRSTSFPSITSEAFWRKTTLKALCHFRFRVFCTWLISQQWCDNVILLFIALNCITLAMERPNIPPVCPERKFLTTANYVFTVVFAIEMFIKVIANGLFYDENAYFTSGWNIMDGSLVSISIIDLLMSVISESSPKIFGILRVFRLLRSLRPLRVINRAPGLKLVVQTLLSSLRPIGNIVLICCTFFIIFGILGVQLFKGTFFHCEGENIKGIKNKTDCLERQGNVWINRKYNFDDLGKALMSLFVLSSRDGWVNIMYTGLDSVGVDQQVKTKFQRFRLLLKVAPNFLVLYKCLPLPLCHEVRISRGEVHYEMNSTVFKLFKLTK